MTEFENNLNICKDTPKCNNQHTNKEELQPGSLERTVENLLGLAISFTLAKPHHQF